MSKLFKFPAIHAIGWIPYFKNLTPIMHTNYALYASHSMLKRMACDTLFSTGNDTVGHATAFNSEKDFDSFLKTKEYRGALLVDKIELTCHSDGSYELANTTNSENLCIGFTPMFRTTKFGRRTFFSKGIGHIQGPNIDCEIDGVWLNYSVFFRIGAFGAFIAKLLTGGDVPHASLAISCFFRNDGTQDVWVNGTFIPSQIWNISVNSLIKWEHDMLTNSLTHIENFFEHDKKRGIFNDNYPSQKLI